MAAAIDTVLRPVKHVHYACIAPVAHGNGRLYSDFLMYKHPSNVSSLCPFYNRVFLCNIRATGAILINTCALRHYGI